MFIESVDFSVAADEIFGFLGPSGAGKSTLQKILTGLLSRYGGSVTVDGEEAGRHGDGFYNKIGVDFEFPSLYEKLTGRENMKFFGSLYPAHRDIDALLESVGLLHDAEKKVGEYSKGMKSRLNFVKALLHDPKILFLDEPTSGLDPSNARVMKDIILAEKARGKTIVLTTHNMYDATELCDRVAFIVDGQIKALDSPHSLIMSRGAGKIGYSYFEDGREIKAEVPVNQTAGDAVLLSLMRENRITSIHSGEPTLNDIFVELTGRQLQ
jgi:fluoroquinolone transport system ATP-binding protein